MTFSTICMCSEYPVISDNDIDNFRYITLANDAN
jgi:hypothetical protein